MNELNTIARDLLLKRAAIEQLQKEADALADRIKEAMAERGEETLAGDGWKASWKNVTSSRFDGRAFKAADPALYAQYTRETVTTRFLVSAA